MNVESVLAIIGTGGGAFIITQVLDFVQKRATSHDTKAQALSDHMSAASAQVFDQQVEVIKALREREATREQALNVAITRADAEHIRAQTMYEQIAQMRIVLLSVVSFLRNITQTPDPSPLRETATQLIPQIESQLAATTPREH
jgi:shikimate kinase